MNAVARTETDVAGSGKLLGLSWAHFLNDGAANYLPGVLPAVLVSLHEPVRMAGVLVASLWIGQASQPLMGWVADRVGGRSLIVAGLLASSLGGGLLGMAKDTWMLIVLLLLIGLGSSLFHPQALAAARSLAATSQGFLIAAFLVGGELGRGIWPTAVSVIGTDLGLESLWILALPALVTVPLLLRWAPRLRARPGAGAPIRWREHLAPMMLLTSYTSARALVTFGLVTFIPIMWHVRGGTLVSGASIITTMLVIGVIGNLGGGYLADRLGRRPVLLVSALATSAPTLPIAYVDGYWLWIVAAFLGISMFLSASATVLIGQDMFRENPSMGSGVALGLANGIGALLVLVIGFLVNESDVVTVFWVLAGVMLLSALSALAFPRSLVQRPTW
jgi:FSR family fosmidomycin resistance protein-like MFS transporter